MTTPYRGYSEIPSGVTPDVPYRVNLALREIDADVDDVNKALTDSIESTEYRLGASLAAAEYRLGAEIDDVEGTVTGSLTATESRITITQDAADQRLTALETIANLVPGDVTDATMASIAAQAGSQFSEGLRDRNKFVTASLPLPLPTGTDDHAAVQSVLDSAAALGLTALVPGNVEYKLSAPLTFQDNARLEGRGPGSKFSLLPGADCPVFTNADHVNGNTGISLAGVYGETNKADQTVGLSVAHFVRVTESEFRRLKLRGGKRILPYPEGNRGEGLELEFSDRNIVDGIYSLDCDYDAVKLRTSCYNQISNVVASNCGKGGVQLAYAQGRDEMLWESGSNYNTVDNIIVTHPTGTPSTGNSPQTNGITLHTASHNTITNLIVWGTMVGIATAGSDASVVGNIVRGASIETRASQTCLAVKCGTGNTYDAIYVKLISGTGGYFTEINGNRNTIANSQFYRGGATGTWSHRFLAGGFENTLLWNMNDADAASYGGTVDDSNGTGRHLILERGRQGSYGLGMSKDFGTGVGVLGLGHAKVDPTASSPNGTLIYSQGDGTKSALKARSSNGTLSTLAGDYVAVAASYTLDTRDRYIIANGASITITAPSAYKGRRITIKNINSTTATVAGSGNLIDGAATRTLAQWAVLELLGTGTNWLIV